MIILILIALIGGGFGGWRACLRYTDNKMIEENLFLRNNTIDLKQTLNYWKEQSAYNKEIANSTIINHNNNLRNTLDTILNLLEKQNKGSLKEDEKESIQNIIKTIKGGISSSHVE